MKARAAELLSAVLVDTGPLVVLLNATDSRHATVSAQLRRIKPPFISCEAVLAEATHRVRQLHGGRAALLEVVDGGFLRRIQAHAAGCFKALLRSGPGCGGWRRLVWLHLSGWVLIARVRPQHRPLSAAYETGCEFVAAKVAVNEPKTPLDLSSARGNMTSETKMPFLRPIARKSWAPDTDDARLAGDSGPPSGAEVAATVHSFARRCRLNRLSTSPPNHGRHCAGTASWQAVA